MSASPTNWNKLTVAQLKDELTKRELDTAGKKADLVDRLVKHEAEQPTSNGEKEGEAEIMEEGGDAAAEEVDEDKLLGEEPMEADADSADVKADGEEKADGDKAEDETTADGEGESEEKKADAEEEVPEIISEELRTKLIEENPLVPRKEDMRRERATEFRLRRVYAWPFLFEELQSDVVVEGLSKCLYFTSRIMEKFPKPKKQTPKPKVEEKKEEKKEDAEEKKEDGGEEEKKDGEEEVKEETAEGEGEEEKKPEEAEAEVKAEVKDEPAEQESMEAEEEEEEEEVDDGIKKFSLEMQFKCYNDAKSTYDALVAFKEDLKVRQLGPDETDDSIKELKILHPEEVSDRLIYIGNLPEDVTDQQVESLFSDARYVFVVRESPNENGERKCSGHAYVEFMSIKAMQKATEACKDAEDIVIGENKLQVIKYSRNVIMDVARDLMPDKERTNLSRQFGTLRSKISRARKGMMMVNQMEMAKMERRAQALSKKMHQDRRIRGILGYEIPDQPKNEGGNYQRGGGGAGGRGRGGDRGRGGGRGRGRGGPPSLLEMSRGGRQGYGGRQDWNMGGGYGGGYASYGRGGGGAGGYGSNRGGYGGGGYQQQAYGGGGYGGGYQSYGGGYQNAGGNWRGQNKGGWNQQSGGGGRGRRY